MTKTRKPAIITGHFISVWSEGVVTTDATLNLKTGEIEAKFAEAPDMGNLEREYFTDGDEEEHEVCPICHRFVQEIRMVEGPFKTLDELPVCKDPDCESNQP